jgi:hypothetical protein
MLQSLQSYPIDLILAIDGRYDIHPSDNILSDKQARDLFKGYQTPYKLIDAPNLTQNAKRQIYFDKAAEYRLDVIIVMDSDEYFIHDKTVWSAFLTELEQKVRGNEHTYIQCYCIPTLLIDKGIQRMPEGYIENLPRLFTNPSTLQYVEDHYTIRNKSTGVLMTTQSNQVLSNILLGHDHKLRSKTYNEHCKQYEDDLIVYENENRGKRIDAFIQARDSKLNEICKV